MDLPVGVVGELDAELVVDGPFEVGFGALENADDVFEPGDEGADLPAERSPGRVHWFNDQRLHSHCGDVPPAEFEAAFYAAHQTAPAGVGNQ